MPNDDSATNLWKSNDGHENVPTAVELCELARSEENRSIRARWIGFAVAIVLAGLFLWNVLVISDRWIRLGQAWIFGAICYLMAQIVLHKLKRMRTDQACAQFLTGQFEEKRRRYLAIRRGLFLFVPGIGLTVWGGGPALRARSLGFDPTSWQVRFAPIAIVAVLLTLVWIAFGKAAQKSADEQTAIQRAIESQK